MSTTPPTFPCSKWADCSCALSSGTCGCGDDCGCGTVTPDAVRAAMSSMCAFSDCNCGAGCSCGAACVCGGTARKDTAAWVASVKAVEAGADGCKCTKTDGVCGCGDGCSCGGKC